MSGLRKIVHLQALRAVAASSVVVDHAIEYLIRRGGLPDTLYPLAWCFGWVGVATFFVISGVILIRSSANLFGEPGGAGRFAVRRLIRVMPLYWLTTLLFAAVAVARHQPPPLADLARSFAFIPYAAAGESVMRPVAGHGWTLNYEMLFYAIFALCLLLPRRIGPAALLLATPVLVLAGALTRGAAPYLDPVTPWQFWTDPIMVTFGIGVAIGLAELRAPRWHAMRNPLLLTLAIVAAELAAFQLLSRASPIPLGWRAVFAAGAAASVMLCTSAGGHRLAGVGRLFETAGDASYSTYLFHPLVLMGLIAAWGHVPFADRMPWAFVAGGVIACNLVGWLSYRFLEGPLTAWLRARFEVRRRPA